MKSVLQESKVDRSKVINVAIGTTHFVNAVVENDARRLSRVAVIRLCGPYTKKVCCVSIVQLSNSNSLSSFECPGLGLVSSLQVKSVEDCSN